MATDGQIKRIRNEYDRTKDRNKGTTWTKKISGGTDGDMNKITFSGRPDLSMS
jgi:hypothetical protein